MRARILLAALLLAGLPGRASAEFVDHIRVQNWNGGAWYNSDTGQFSHCSLEADYVSGMTVYLWWTGNGFAVVLQSPGWKLNVGDVSPVQLAIDRFWSQYADAEAITVNSAVIRFGYDDVAVDAFRHGNLLIASTGYDNLQFSLRGTNAAISALQNCYARHGKRGY